MELQSFPANYITKREMAPILAPVIQHKFKTPDYLKGILAQDLPGNTAGAKRFAAVSDFPAFIHGLDSHQTNMNLYEVLSNNRPVYPYVDAEWDPAQLEEEATLRLIISIYASCLQSIGITTNGVSMYTASGSYEKYDSGKKASYHVIFETDKVFENTLYQAHFFKTIVTKYINDNDISNLLTFTNKGSEQLAIDSSVYKGNQMYRLPYQSKYGSTRILIPCIFEDDFVPISELICVGVYDNPNSINFIKMDNYNRDTYVAPSTEVSKDNTDFSLIESLCPLLNKTIFDNFHSCTKFIWACWHHEQSDRMRTLIHKWCNLSHKYDAKWVDNIIKSYQFKGISIATIIKWAKETNYEKASELCLSHKVKYSNELFAIQLPSEEVKQEIYSERYVKPIPIEENNTIMIKSHLGTGKTTQITTILKEYIKKRVLIVSARKSYTRYLQGDLIKEGICFTSYEDISTGYSTESHLIIQVESLWKLFLMKVEPYDLVILDESESILNQLHSIHTNGMNLITNHQVLESVVSSATKVIFADAFLSDRTNVFMSYLRKLNTSIFIYNTFIPYKRQAIYLKPIGKDLRVANINGFEERILSALKDGKKIVVVWTSRSKGKAFARKFLESSSYSWRFYSSESTSEQTKELADVETSWSSIQCLMMTTSITVGISYNPSKESIWFDEAFLYGTSCSALPRDIAQALLRVRELKSNKLTYVIDTRAIGRGVCGKDAISEMLAIKEDRLIREHPIAKWTTAPQWVKDIHIMNENEVATSKCEYKDVLEEYLKLCGYDIIEETHIPDSSIANVKINEIMKWDEIDTIDSDTAYEIRKMMKAGDATSDDIWEWKKWNFIAQFSSDCYGDLLCIWWSRFFESGREDAFWRIVKEKRWTIEQMAIKEGESRYAMMADREIDKRKAFEEFLEILGMKHSQEEKVFSHEELESIGGKLEKIEKRLRENMGMRSSRRKGEWTIKNTMDLIECILGEWGCCDCLSMDTRPRINGIPTRKYTINLNKNNVIWNNIIVSNVTVLDSFSIKL